MEESPSTSVLDGEIIGIKFSLANHQAICTASISDCPISHASQLGNPFLGLPLEYGKCESCGTAEPGKCEGHFGYIELPIPIYHPCHVSELKKMLSLLCLKCLKMKNNKVQSKSNGISQRLLSSCCEEASQISIKEDKKADGGACYLQLKLPSRSFRNNSWNFLDKYGYRYGETSTRTLLASEVIEILKKMPEPTRKKLVGKGYFPQTGFILQYLPVPPNCLSVPDISDGVSIMSSDQSVTMLKKVLKQVEIIKNSRSGTPTFEAHEVEANDLQCAVEQYLQIRGTAKKSRASDRPNHESNESSTKAWLEKMRTLFIKKGSGFSSRSVITGDSYNGVNQIGLPFEIAQRITFEERVNVHNMKYLQDLVDKKLCLTYRDGQSTYSLREGSMGHTFLKPGQMVHRRIMDGDIVFINRPPTTHKHALQALSVYIHEDHTVKINPLICGPLSADFDGDCVHLFYPQSLAAKAEVYELFSVGKQLLSSHNGNLTLQLAADSLLSLKMLFKSLFIDRYSAQQLSMFAASSLPQPAILKDYPSGPHWTALQLLETVLPESFDCHGERHLIVNSSVLRMDLTRDVVQSLTNEVLTSLYSEKGPNEVIRFLNDLQPMLMEHLDMNGFSIGLNDFAFPMDAVNNIIKDVQDLSPLLYHLRSVYDEQLEKRLENHLRLVKVPASDFISRSSALGDLIDSKSDSSMNKVVQQIGFLGEQISDRGKLYTKTLVEDVASFFRAKYPFRADYPSGEHGLVKSCFFHGLDPYEEMVHAISSREVIVRSSRGLTEPGTLFKNLMAILRDVVICYDGTVRNVSSNSIIQFQYEARDKNKKTPRLPPGEPVGVLAATAMSNPAYKAVLDSSPSSNSSWELMKEVLLCRVNFKNDPSDRRVILYLNDCECGRKVCREHASFLVENHLKKVSLKDAAVEFTIEYKRQRHLSESSEMDAGLIGHVHLNKNILDKFNISMQDVLQKCQEAINSLRKKKQLGHLFKRITLSISECCSFQQQGAIEWSEMPCLMFYWQDTSDTSLEINSHILANIICPVLLQTIIKGDPRISSVNIMWMSPETTTWIRSPGKTRIGELVLDIVLEKAAVKLSGDAWRIVLDSCLPVLHLVDTCRSIPYGIKQVQELLGISCAFDQAVQRLSTSVAMVTKGVLREHLILLANSMTCAGNLVGFNIGGYKALSRSLNVQVPFTEATLYTPRRCFERAAEKCHTDALSSIVAACSWGRHVSVGTGSRFELLWDTKEDGHKHTSTDVYSLLQLVKKTPAGAVSDSGCLGADLDDIWEDDNQELGMSPDQISDFPKAVFEDEIQLPNGSTWDGDASGHAEINGDGDWANKIVESGWANKTDDTAWAKKPDDTAWAKKPDDTAWAKKPDDTAWAKKPEDTFWAKKPDDTAWAKKPDDTAWAKKPDDTAWAKKPDDTAWAKKPEDTAWAKKPEDTAWAKKPEDTSWAKKPVDTAWAKNPNDTAWAKKPDETSGEKKPEDKAWGTPTKVNQPATSHAWGAGSERGTENESPSQWGHQSGSSYKKDQSESSSVWEKRLNQPSTAGRGNMEQSSCWEKSVEVAEAEFKQPSSGGWGNGAGNDKETQSQWGQQTGSRFKNPNSENAHGWAKKVEAEDKAESGFQKQSSGGWDDTEATKGPTDPEPSSGWSKKVEVAAGETGGWGSSNELSQSTNSNAWGSPSPSPSAGGGSNFSKNRSNNSRGWGSYDGGDWKIKKNYPPKSPGVFNEDSGANGAFIPRPRFEKYSPEEQPIQAEVEPMMQSIKRIMHQSGYKDGDKLSAEDQSYILDNVFIHHPDKEVKMGSGVDHVMVNRHSTFQETRCFYIVSTDGRTADFSTRKCVEKFVQGKFTPEHADSFLIKCFPRKNREVREQSQNPEQNQNVEQSQNP